MEQALESDRVRLPVVEKLAELAAEKDETIRQRRSSSTREATVGQCSQLASLLLYDTISGVLTAGIDSEDLHASSFAVWLAAFWGL